MQQFRLETERMVMRPLSVDDAERMYLLNSDPEVLRYTGDIPFESIESAYLFLKNYTEYEKNKMGRFSCFLKADGTYLGWCGLRLQKDKNLRVIDLGYRFFARYWNQGYATEASKVSLAYGFNTIKLDIITATTNRQNEGSIKVINKLGMTYAHTQEMTNEILDTYRITRDEYLKKVNLLS